MTESLADKVFHGLKVIVLQEDAAMKELEAAVISHDQKYILSCREKLHALMDQRMDGMTTLWNLAHPQKR